MERLVNLGYAAYLVGVAVFLWCLSVAPVYAQAQISGAAVVPPSGARASATPATASSGRPSTIQIKQNIILQQVAILQRQLIDVRRCIYTASLPQVLMDPTGMVNRVPQTDIVNCSRQLQTITRKLASLSRESSQLLQDAQMEAFTLQRLLEAQKAKARQQAQSDQ